VLSAALHLCIWWEGGFDELFACLLFPSSSGMGGRTTMMIYTIIAQLEWIQQPLLGVLPSFTFLFEGLLHAIQYAKLSEYGAAIEHENVEMMGWIPHRYMSVAPLFFCIWKNSVRTMIWKIIAHLESLLCGNEATSNLLEYIDSARSPNSGWIGGAE